MIQIEQVISDAIDLMDLTINVSSSQETGDSDLILYVDKTWYIQKGTRIEIDGDIYKVIDFTLNTSITLDDVGGLTTPESITLPNPTFYYGKTKVVNYKLNSIMDKTTLYPIIWMQENLGRTAPADVDSSYDSDGSVRLFFLNNANLEDWERADHQTEVIEPLNTVVDEFLRVIDNNGTTGKLGDNQTINHALFGVSGLLNSADTVKNMFAENLSGIEINPSIPILKSTNCMTL